MLKACFQSGLRPHSGLDRYIHDLATRTDKSDDLRTIAQLREDREALQRRVEELETEIAFLRRKLEA
jgi:uncharacterized protein YceH (UPF0502 family)